MGIRKVSIKRQAQLDEYRPLRIEYLINNPFCEVSDCTNHSTDVHHMRGRSGKQLLVVEDFLATCREDHVYIEEHPDWAKAKGYSRSRLAI